MRHCGAARGPRRRRLSAYYLLLHNVEIETSFEPRAVSSTTTHESRRQRLTHLNLRQLFQYEDGPG